jgi:hypothetical protein
MMAVLDANTQLKALLWFNFSLAWLGLGETESKQARNKESELAELQYPLNLAFRRCRRESMTIIAIADRINIDGFSIVSFMWLPGSSWLSFI